MFKEMFLEAKPKLDKEVKKILSDLDKLLDLDNVVLTGDDLKLVKKTKTLDESLNESDFKAQLMAKLSQYKHINSFKAGNVGNKVDDGDVVIDGTLVDGSKVYNNIKFKGLDKAQTQVMLKSLNKALPALNKKLEKVFSKS